MPHHPKSRQERLALRSRLSKTFTDARERVARRVDRHGTYVAEQKAERKGRGDITVD